MKDFNCPAEGGTAPTDRECWQRALDCAYDSVTGHFGTVVATQGIFYVINDTLKIANSYGGVIEGNGAKLLWTGPSASDKPLLRLLDTFHLRIEDLVLLSGPSAPLHTAVLVGNPSTPGFTSSHLTLDHVDIEGTDTGGLQYGIRFAGPQSGIPGLTLLDANNDMSSITNTSILNVMKAAISIEHSQSMQHRLVAVNASGAAHNGEYTSDDTDPVSGPIVGASFIRLKAGSFGLVGGYHGNFRNAEYYLEAPQSMLSIIDSVSEGCRRFIRTSYGVSGATFPVHVLNSRFATDGLELRPEPGCPNPDLHCDNETFALDRRIVDWHRFGPLTIRGLHMDGPWVQTAPFPHFYLNPAGAVPSNPDVMPFELSGLDNWNRDSALHDLINPTSSAVKITAYNNLCTAGTPGSDEEARPCTGLSGGADQWPATLLNKDLRDATNLLRLNPSELDATGVGATGQVLTKAATDQFSWVPMPSTASAFGTFDVSDGTDPVADAPTDTLTLAKGRSITVTGDASSDTITVAAEPELYSDSESIWIKSPTTGNPTDDDTVQIKIPVAATLKRVSCSTKTGTVTISFEERTEAAPNTATSSLMSTLSCTNSGTASTTTFTDSDIAANAPLNLNIVSATGSPTGLRVHVNFERKD